MSSVSGQVTSMAAGGAMISAVILVCEALPGWFLYRVNALDEILYEMLCLSIGTLLGLCVVELIPDTYAKVANGLLRIEVVTLMLLAGFFIPFFIEKFIRKGKGGKFRRLANQFENKRKAKPIEFKQIHDLEMEPVKVTTSNDDFNATTAVIPSDATSIESESGKVVSAISRAQKDGSDFALMFVMLFSDVVDNFVDGCLLASGWISGFDIGIATSIAIFMDVLPNLTSSYAVFIQAGASEFKALILNIIAALPLLFGTGFILALSTNPNVSQTEVTYLSSFATGAFLYMTAADLVPIINNHWSNYLRAASQFLTIGLGIFIQCAVRVFARTYSAHS